MLYDDELFIKKSTLPGSGRGLFTSKFIPKGTLITEYTGKITTWEEADHDDGNNLYIYYVTKNHVIDASKNKKMLARFANDANGKSKIKGVTTNSIYTVEGKRVYIKSTKDIPAGSEIFVSYGKDYWDVIRKNGL
jgi:uncharacterized protein